MRFSCASIGSPAKQKGIVSGVLKGKQAGFGLHKRAVPCRRAAVYNLTDPATKATPYLAVPPPVTTPDEQYAENE